MRAMPPRKLIKTVHVRISEEFLAVLVEKAAKARRSLSDYIRMTLEETEK